jgi:hypothetical protein
MVVPPLFGGHMVKLIKNLLHKLLKTDESQTTFQQTIDEISQQAEDEFNKLVTEDLKAREAAKEATKPVVDPAPVIPPLPTPVPKPHLIDGVKLLADPPANKFASFNINFGTDIEHCTDGSLGIYINNIIFSGTNTSGVAYVKEMSPEILRATIVLLTHALSDHVTNSPCDFKRVVVPTKDDDNFTFPMKPLKPEDMN